MTNLITMALAALLSVESSCGRNGSDGDHGKAVGVYQIHKCAVDEANRIVGYKKWTYGDRRNPAKSREICRATLERHLRRGVKDPVELCCKWRNPYGKRAPLWYRKRVAKVLENEYAEQ